MKKTLLSLATLATLSTLTHAQIFSEDFDGNGPGISAWTVLDLDNKTPDPNVSFITNGWNVIDLDGDNGRFGGPAGDHAAASTSWYLPAGASNDWLITPLINLSSATNPRLRYSVKSQDPSFRDGYLLKVAPNGGNTAADFTDTLFSVTAENSHEGKPWTERVFSLAQYAGQSIRIAWVNNSNDMFMLLVDDIFVEETPENVPQNIPFTETFENDSQTRQFWTNQNVVGSANWTYNNGSSGGNLTTAYNGALNARFVSTSGTNSPITKLISPVINAGSNTDAYLEFHHANPDWLGDVNALKVYYRLDETSDWVELFSQIDPVETWTKQQIQLPAVSQTMQFAFEGINNFGRANVIDDVKIVPGLVPMVTTLPFNETFEDDSTTRPGWTQENVVGSRNWTFATGAGNGDITTANNGTLNARFYSGSGTNSPITRLITPIIDGGNTTSAFLQFNYGQQDYAGDINALKVYYRANPSSEWQLIFQNSAAVNTWTQKQVNIPTVTREMQFAFEGINNWGYANVLDDVQVLAGVADPLPEVCGVNNVSNAMENGIGNLINFTYANDFRVNSASKIDISQVSFNLITAAGGISSATISIVEDYFGTPTDNVLYTFTGAPTATENIGTNFGFSFDKYTYDLSEVLTLENTSNTHKTYWLKVEGVTPDSGTNAYWEVTSEDASEYPMIVLDPDTNQWQSLPNEGVFTIVGECSPLDLPTSCEQSTPSNNFENGFGNLITAEIGNDFQIEANTSFNLQKIKVNLMTSTGATSGTIKIYENNDGIPGNEVYSFTATPERQNVGTAFGFDVSSYTFTLPEPLLLEAPADQVGTYWIGVSGLSVLSGTSSFWEATSDVSNTLYRTKFNGSNGWVELTNPDFDGVFSIEGECETLSINDQVIEVSKLSFYPNPVTDVLYVKHKLAVEGIDVFNLTGQKVMTTKVKTDGSVNLSSLPKGVYIVNATLADGTNQTFKVIKK